MDNTTNCERPVPKPRPRKQLLISDSKESPKIPYQNVQIDDLLDKNLNKNNENKNFNEKLTNNTKNYGNVVSQLNNLNIDKTTTDSSNRSEDSEYSKPSKTVRNKKKTDIDYVNVVIDKQQNIKPIPAPRRQLSTTESSNNETYSNVELDKINNNQETLTNISAVSNQPIIITRPAPKLPEKTKRRQLSIKSEDCSTFTISSLSELETYDVPRDRRTSVSNCSMHSSNSTESTKSTDGPSKFQTTAPGELLKSIGATSKLLTESISERVTAKFKDAKHKIDKNPKFHFISEHTKNASSKLKNVRKKFGNTKEEKRIPEFNPDRPQTLPPNNEIFISSTALTTSANNISTSTSNKRTVASSTVTITSSTTTTTTTTTRTRTNTQLSIHQPSTSDQFSNNNLDVTYDLPKKSRSSRSVDDDGTSKTSKKSLNQLELEYGPPSYEESIKSPTKFTDSSLSISTASSNSVTYQSNFNRNTSLTQSMFSAIGDRGSPINKNFTITSSSSPTTLLPPSPSSSSSSTEMTKSHNKSDTNIYATISEKPPIQSLSHKNICVSDSDEDADNNPCPNFPAPILNREHIYGKLKRQEPISASTSISPIPSSSSSTSAAATAAATAVTQAANNKKKTIVRHKKSTDYEETQIRVKSPKDYASNRATIDSNESNLILSLEERFPKIFSRDVSTINNPEKSDSWSYQSMAHQNIDEDCGDGMSILSNSPEPIYTNQQKQPRSLGSMIINNVNVEENVYGVLYSPPSTSNTILEPQSPNIINGGTKEKKLSQIKYEKLKEEPINNDILIEFDPLVSSSFVGGLNNAKSNQLILLENLLGEDTYGTIERNNQLAGTLNAFANGDEDDDDDEDDDEDSLKLSDCDEGPDSCNSPAKSNEDYLPNIPSTSSVDPQTSSNKKKLLRTDNQTIPKHDSVIIHQNTNLNYDSDSDNNDNLQYNLDNEIIKPYLAKHDPSSFTSAQVDLSRSQPSQSNWFIDNESDGYLNPINESKTTDQAKAKRKNSKDEKKSSKIDPPSYSEAIAEHSTFFDSQIIDGTDAVTVTTGLKEPSPKPKMKTMFTNVLSKMEGINLGIKRKTSFNKQKTSSDGNGNDVHVILEMIPKPALTNRLILHEGHLIRLPSGGVVEDILKELQSRKAYIRDKRFQAYCDKDYKVPKENLPLEFITTIQCVSTHKFSNNSLDIHCFEITTALPKTTVLTNPNMLMTSTNSGNCKTQRVCHLYGVAKESERYLWMQKLFESMTDVFPSAFTCKFYRAGWCYLKNSITSQWSGAWLMLQKTKRKLIFYTNGEMNLECMDLRKARCVVLKECDDSIKNLHIESGPIMMIDCPPFTVYFIMSSPRETKIWRHIIKEVAQNNGPTLKDQQLTKDNVPVLVDKCINFIYAHGSMSEGIFRKSGSENSIQKLLHLFRTDAFSVQITRTEYTEHDVANVLKRFMRDLPERLIGPFAVSFISVSEMKSKRERITAYRELLLRLPAIEYHTLKKVIGHLNFIQSQKHRNKMGVDNLSIIWGPTLLQDKRSSEMQYSQKEAEVIVDLITFYKNLYPLTTDEISKEQIMLTVLQKYHAAAENLSDSVKQSGDLKVWVTIDENPENELEEKQQVNVTLTPTKTVYDLCKELASKIKREPHTVTLNEIILNGSLKRPLHYTEKVFDIVLKWSYWPENDRKNNFLQLSPGKFLREVERALRMLPIVSPNKELKFADCKTKSFKSYSLELNDGKISIFKKEKNSVNKVRDLDLRKTIAYLGCEKKRDFQLRWAITLIDVIDDVSKNILRSRESPFIGHVIAGTNSNDQIVWYSSILHSLYYDDLMPNPEMIIT